MATSAISRTAAATGAPAVAAEATTPGSAAAPAAVHAKTARTDNSSDIDSEVQSNKPLFLNFTAELAPFNSAKKKQKKGNVYKVSGVNILNRNSVDSKTALERLQRRRENHNFVERRRRDNINHTITTLSTLIPYCTEDGVKLNKGSILHMAVEYIRDIQEINTALTEENLRLGGTTGVTLPAALRQRRLQQYQEQQEQQRRRGSSANSGIDTMPHSHDEDEMDDDDDNYNYSSHVSPILSSAATSPRFAPASATISAAITTNNTNSVASSRASSSSGHSSIGSNGVKNSGTAKGKNAANKGKKRSSSSSNNNGNVIAACEKKFMLSSARTTASSLLQPPASDIHIHGNVAAVVNGVISPPLTTATPSAAHSTNTSPVALAAAVSSAPHSAHLGPGQQPVSAASSLRKNNHARHSYHNLQNLRSNTTLESPATSATPANVGHFMPSLQLSAAQSVPHSPVYSGMAHTNNEGSGSTSGTHTPLPPIGAIAPGSRILTPGATAFNGISQNKQHQQLPSVHGSVAGVGSKSRSMARLPTQSMPSSPTLRSQTFYMSNGPMSSSASRIDSLNNAGHQQEGSVYNHRQAPAGAFGTHPFFSSDVSSIRHHIQQQSQPYNNRQQPYAGAQSLQNTPLMRPSRESVFGDGFELPSLHASSPTVGQQQQQQK
ncbi:hypothetical protein GGI26_006372 [Coemansia sp. RSA 1358]|nr:hypothetical protein GGI26_006372 [Coemansia sp. RSA 1358]